MRLIRLTIPVALALATSLAFGRQGVTYHGLLSEPLGQAGLSIDPGTGYLLIQGLGSSGNDGVRVRHPSFHGHDVGGVFMEFDPFGGITSGQRVSVKTLATIDAASDQLVAEMTVEEVGGLVELRTTFPTATDSSKLVEFLLDGVVVASVPGITGPVIGQLIPGPMGNDPILTDVHYTEEKHYDPHQPWLEPELRIREENTWLHRWDNERAPVVMQLLGSIAPTLVTSVRVTSAPLDGALSDQRTEIRLRNTPDVSIRTQGIIAPFGTPTRGHAQAAMSVTQQGGVLAQNVGSSGLDGLVFNVAKSRAFALDLAGLPAPSTLPLGARFDVRAVGTIGGQEGEEIGTLSMIKTGGPFTVSVDSNSGVDLVNLVLYNLGSVLTTLQLDNEDLIRFVVGPRNWELCIPGPDPIPYFSLRWASTIQATVPGVSVFSIDEIRIVPLGQAPTVSSIDFVRLTGKSLGAFEVTDLRSEPVPMPTTYCTAKVNSQGCTPAIGFTGQASQSVNDFVITARNLINKKVGLLIYGFGSAAIPFQGGQLCVQPPLRRSPPLNSGGSASGVDCTGTFGFPFTAALAA